MQLNFTAEVHTIVFKEVIPLPPLYTRIICTPAETVDTLSGKQQ